MIRSGLLAACLACACTGEKSSAPVTTEEAAAVVPTACLALEDLGRTEIRYVMADAAVDGDGSAARPFGSIEAAIAAATPQTEIRVASGSYGEPVLIDDPVAQVGLALRACESGGVVIASSLTIRGPTGAALHDLRISGVVVEGTLYVTGGYDIAISDVVVTTTDTAVLVSNAAVALSGILQFSTQTNPEADALYVSDSEVTLDGSLEISGGKVGLALTTESTFRGAAGSTLYIHDNASCAVVASANASALIEGSLSVADAYCAVAAGTGGAISVVGALDATRVTYGALAVVAGTVTVTDGSVSEATGNALNAYGGELTVSGAWVVDGALRAGAAQPGAGGELGLLYVAPSGSISSNSAAQSAFYALAGGEIRNAGLLTAEGGASYNVYVNGGSWTTEGSGRLEVAGGGRDSVVVTGGGYMQLGDAEIVDPLLAGLYVHDGTLDVIGAVRVSGALGAAGAYFGTGDLAEGPAVVVVSGSLTVENPVGVGVYVNPTAALSLASEGMVTVVDPGSYAVYLNGGAWISEGTGRLEIDGGLAVGFAVTVGGMAALGDGEIVTPGLFGIWVREGTLNVTGTLRVTDAAGSSNAGVLVGSSSSTLPAALSVSGALMTEGGGGIGMQVYAPGVVTVEDAGLLSVTDAGSTGVWVAGGTLTIAPGGTLRIASPGGSGIYAPTGTVDAPGRVEVVDPSGACIGIGTGSLLLADAVVADCYAWGIYGVGGAMSLANVTVDGVWGDSPYGDGILLRDLSAPATLTNVSVLNAERAGVLIVGSTGSWTGGEVANNGWAVVHQDCTAGEEMSLTGVEANDNADDTIYGCDGGVTFDLP